MTTLFCKTVETVNDHNFYSINTLINQGVNETNRLYFNRFIHPPLVERFFQDYRACINVSKVIYG